MSIAVLGATGHLGRAAIDHLLARGVAPSELIAAGRAVEKLDGLRERGVDVRAVDYADAASIDAALAGSRVVLLVSGSEIGQRVAQHAAVIAAAERVGAQRLVYTSIVNALDSQHLLAPEHADTERMLAASSLAVTVLRNNWYIENFAADVATAAETGVVASGAGEGRIASATRDEYAEAAAVALLDDDHAGQTYELTGPEGWNHLELASALSELLGREVVYDALDPEEQRAQLTSAGLDEATAGFIVGLDANTRAGELAAVSADLEQLLGRRPRDLRAQLATLIS